MALAAGGGAVQTDAIVSPDGPAAAVADSTQGQPFSVTLVDPAPGSVFQNSPSTLTLQFNNPIIPDTLFTDVGIIQTDSGGNPTGWYVVPNSDQLNLDNSATQLTVNVGQVLPSGDYQVWLFGSSGITVIAGDSIVPDGNTLILGDFDVTGTGVTLADAVDLATPGRTPIEVPGTLDFETNPYAVSLYRIQLDQGHFWRLGLEVQAQRDGVALDTALTLFNAQGQPIATDDIGRKDDPMDPFLFAGVQPGTYYIGVSGTGNLPGLPGGYDPVTGSPGSVVQTQNGGAYTLYVVADAVDTPPQVRNFSVDYADARSATPTGLTLKFTRAISLTGSIGDLAPGLDQGIVVTDGDGRNWPVEASGYDEADASVSYLFESPLPSGHYTVQLPEQGGLVDLAGHSPIALGEPPGVLGSFDVSPASDSDDPNDLGALLPGAGDQGRAVELALAPGAAVSYRFVLTVPGLYDLQLHSDEAVLSAQLTTAGATYSIDPGGDNYTQLTPGEYSIRIQNSGTVAIHAQLVLQAAVVGTELFLASGVGQGPGLSLRLISFPDPVIQPPPATPVLIQTSPIAPSPIATPIATLPSPVSTPVVTSPSILPSPISTPVATSPSILRVSVSTSVATPPTSAAIDPVARDLSVTSQSPLLNLDSARSQMAPIVRLSFLGMGSDMVGRPSRAGLRGASPEQGLSSQNESMSVAGVTQSQQLSIYRDLWIRRSTSQLEVPEIASAIIAARSELMAADIGVNPRRAILQIGGFMDWVSHMTTAGSPLVGLWLSTGPSSNRSRAVVATNAGSFTHVRSEFAKVGEMAPDQVEAMDQAGTSAEFLRPVVVAFSVALIAQVSRHLTRWWKSRNRSRTLLAAKRLDHASVFHDSMRLDQVAAWVEDSELDASQLLVSRAS
jgi:hypothetical protein